jgi:outer membrane protein
MPRPIPALWYRTGTVLTALAGLTIGIGGCSSPLAVQSERSLQRSVLESLNRELADARRYPEHRETAPWTGLEVLRLRPELVPELERMAGPASYDPRAISGSIGDDLLGRPQQVVQITLETAVKAAVHYNLQVQFARLQPAIAEAQVIAAESAFDWVLQNNLEFTDIDQPRPRTQAGQTTTGPGVDRREAITNSTSLRRQLPSGGVFTFQNDISTTEVNTPGSALTPSPAREAAFTARLEQPLLQGFGSDVTLSQVRLNRNAERDSVAILKRDLIRTITDTERAYWQLAQARRDVLILQRLYDRGVVTRDQVIAREILDATPAQIAQARATVERRLQNLINAQNTLRQASDILKAQMNLPSVTVGDETLVLPVDEPLVAPISYSLVDVLTSAIRNRSEVAQAILSIDNTSIRMQVADNQRLPRLDLRLQARLAGLDNDFTGAYSEVIDGDFVDYTVGLLFEQRLGNRFGEAQYRQRRLERMQAAIAYRNTVQQVMLETKRALRNVLSFHRLIDQSRVARYAATEQLRSFQVEKALVIGHTVQTLDLEFRQQESLAQSEREEIQALTDYNISLALLYQAMGTALERNNIAFQVPGADDPLAEAGLNSSANPVVGVSEGRYMAPRNPPARWPWQAQQPEPEAAQSPPPAIQVPPPTILPPVMREPPPGPSPQPAGTIAPPRP